MARRFITLDVFTSERFTGNPLAVVLDAEGLDDARMQTIAKEFNLSETVFVFPPEDSHQRADIRIFTPGRELPFAGHPTVGTAVLLALLDQSGQPGAVAFGLKEKVGIVPCVVEVKDELSGMARFRLPRLPSSWGEGKESTDCAWALGLDPTEIGFDRHVPSRHSAGVDYDLVPVASLDALARAYPKGEAFDKTFGDSNHPSAYVYTRVPQAEGLRFRARMFGPGMGILEDPATGSAAATFAGALMQCEPLGDGEHNIIIEQGVEMGRPSEIALQMTIKNGALVSAEIGGFAVMVMRGEIVA
ncbi:PhzF family phenazine biosynthesis protein [Microvirga guangxiensis]|uniref:Trans-2,3-dihydro-3-hydroxyanthranilate isomerase n=1 Tax=Microvirga guangxiensis TaxID=549386 RepID=A0A1G5I3Q6_9HYPH|nr:PhzF family phenazine biosynthesis protein [Microvirga guangxiensis]SCY70270.1 trans-2,3-dihydro-3-hydroxyanthranilate isomerase [Microvirga guangxiensis]